MSRGLGSMWLGGGKRQRQNPRPQGSCLSRGASRRHKVVADPLKESARVWAGVGAGRLSLSGGEGLLLGRLCGRHGEADELGHEFFRHGPVCPGVCGGRSLGSRMQRPKGRSTCHNRPSILSGLRAGGCPGRGCWLESTRTLSGSVWILCHPIFAENPHGRPE